MGVGGNGDCFSVSYILYRLGTYELMEFYSRLNTTLRKEISKKFGVESWASANPVMKRKPLMFQATNQLKTSG